MCELCFCAGWMGRIKGTEEQGREVHTLCVTQHDAKAPPLHEPLKIPQCCKDSREQPAHTSKNIGPILSPQDTSNVSGSPLKDSGKSLGVTHILHEPTSPQNPQPFRQDLLVVIDVSHTTCLCLPILL